MTNETIKQAAMTDMGTGFSSLLNVRHKLVAGHFALVDNFSMQIVGNWYVTHLKQKKLSPGNQSVQRFFNEQAGVLINFWTQYQHIVGVFITIFATKYIALYFKYSNSYFDFLK